MRKIVLTLTMAFFTKFSFANEIVATVLFQNLTDKEFTSGVLTVIDLNKSIEVTKAESFIITLPEKGKYQFDFVSEDFIAYTSYPTRINKKKNTITIRLNEKTQLLNEGMLSLPMNLENDLNHEQIDQRIAEGTINFIMHGIDSLIPEEYLKFKEKYGIGLVKQNCIIDPLSFKKTSEYNQMICDYLNNKYGTDWQSELNTKPFGVK